MYTSGNHKHSAEESRRDSWLIDIIKDHDFYECQIRQSLRSLHPHLTDSVSLLCQLGSLEMIVSLWKYQRGWGPRKTHTQFCFSFLKTNSVLTLVSPFLFSFTLWPTFPFHISLSHTSFCLCTMLSLLLFRDLKVFNKPTLFLLNLHCWLSCSCFSSSSYNRQPCPHCVKWSKVCKTKSFGRTRNNIDTSGSCYWN